MRPFNRNKRPKQARPPYRWICRLLHGDSFLEVCTGDHRKPKPDEFMLVAYLKFFRKFKGMGAGWDIDRHRFFVTGRRQLDLKKLKYRRGKSSSYLRHNWERLHGYSRGEPCWTIAEFLEKEKDK